MISKSSTRVILGWSNSSRKMTVLPLNRALTSQDRHRDLAPENVVEPWVEKGVPDRDFSSEIDRG